MPAAVLEASGFVAACFVTPCYLLPLIGLIYGALRYEHSAEDGK